MKYLISILYLLVLIYPLFSQDTFKKLLLNPGLNPPGSSSDVFIKPTPDNGYILMKVIKDTFNSSDTHLIVLKFDVCDNLQWSEAIVYDDPLCRITFGARNITVTEKGEILIVLGSNTCFTDNFFIKLNASGQEIVTKKFKWDGRRFFKIDEAANGDYLLSSRKYPVGTFICRLTKDFDVKWCKKYGGQMIILPLDDGHLGYKRKLIAKYNIDGILVWSKKIEHFDISRITEVQDGFIIISHMNSNGNDPEILRLMKINKSGEVIWVRNPFWFQENAVDQIVLNTIIYHSDDLLVLSKFYSVSGIDKYMISKFNSKGELKNQIIRTQLLNYRNYWVQHIMPHPLKGYLILGLFSNTPPTGKKEFGQIFLDKFDFDLSDNQCGFENVENTNNLSLPDPILSDTPISVETSNISISDFNLTIVDRYLTEVVECGHNFNIDFSRDTTLCFGDTLFLESKRSYENYVWSTGETGKSIIVKKPGLYVLTASDACRTDTDSIMVDYYPDPQLKFTVEPAVSTIFEDVQFKSLTGTIGSVLWDIGIGDTISAYSFKYKYSKNGNYTVKYSFEDQYGCVFSDSTEILVKHIIFSIPNSFTPNGDGLNEKFEPTGFGIKSYSIIIYNRWGEIAFNSENQAWDGGQAPIGLYSYKLEILDEFGEISLQQGRVLLLR